MAHLTEVRVRGDATGAESVIAGYLNQLTKQPVFNRYDAERYLLLASDLPGYTVRLTLRPAGTVAGDVVGDVTVQRTAGLCRLQRSERRLESARPMGRAAARPGLRADRAWRPDHRLGLQHVRFQGAADASSSATISTLARTASASPTSFTYAWAQADHSRRARARKNAAQHVRGRLSVRPPPGLFGPRLGRAWITSTRTLRSTTRSTSPAIACASASSGSASTPRRPTSTMPAIRLAEPPWRASAILELRQGMHILGATDCGPTGSPIAPASAMIAPSRLEGQSDATVFRYTMYGEAAAGPEADARARRPRPICVEAAAQLRGILGRQLHRRPRL